MPSLIIIEDDAIFGGLLAEVATFAGFETEVVSNTQQFSEAYSKQNPDLLTLDISMPDADGFEMIDELVNLDCQSKVIIISGHDEAIMKSAETYGKAKGLNILQTMRKPIEVEALEELLISVINTM
jgi:two-component system, chemotaxis family, chemotaxis protein CheY